jgi:hypothetical protein
MTLQASDTVMGTAVVSGWNVLYVENTLIDTIQCGVRQLNSGIEGLNEGFGMLLSSSLVKTSRTKIHLASCQCQDLEEGGRDIVEASLKHLSDYRTGQL